MKPSPRPWWLDSYLFKTEEELDLFFEDLGANQAYIEEWRSEAKVQERELKDDVGSK